MGLQLKKFFHLHQIYQENKENYIVLLPIKEIQIHDLPRTLLKNSNAYVCTNTLCKSAF